MNFLNRLFSDSGDVSMLRVMSLLSLLAGIGLAFLNHDQSVLIFVSAAFGGKCTQKYLELTAKKETQTTSILSDTLKD
jgi:hypothetical protein